MLSRILNKNPHTRLPRVSQKRVCRGLCQFEFPHGQNLLDLHGSPGVMISKSGRRHLSLFRFCCRSVCTFGQSLPVSLPFNLPFVFRFRSCRGQSSISLLFFLLSFLQCLPLVCLNMKRNLRRSRALETNNGSRNGNPAPGQVLLALAFPFQVLFVVVVLRGFPLQLPFPFWLSAGFLFRGETRTEHETKGKTTSNDKRKEMRTGTKNVPTPLWQDVASTILVY